jgi:hypothetical protein
VLGTRALLAFTNAAGRQPEGRENGVELVPEIDLQGIEVVQAEELQVLREALGEGAAIDVVAGDGLAVGTPAR